MRALSAMPRKHQNGLNRVHSRNARDFGTIRLTRDSRGMLGGTGLDENYDGSALLVSDLPDLPGAASRLDDFVLCAPGCGPKL